MIIFQNINRFKVVHHPHMVKQMNIILVLRLLPIKKEMEKLTTQSKGKTMLVKLTLSVDTLTL